MKYSATKLVNLESGVDYLTDLIFAVHVTKTNENDVKIVTIDDSEAIFPPGSLIRGVVYYIFVKRIEYNEGIFYIGYSYNL